MPIELTNPSGLWVLGLLAPLVVLYILKVRRPRLVVSSTWLWETSQRDLEARNPFRRLRRDVALLIQALAIVALALAMAKPSIRTGLAMVEHVAFVIDTSASMGAVDSGASRLDEARARAREAVSALGADADVMVVDAGNEPRVSMPLDRDRRRFLSVVADLGVRAEQGALARSIALAVERLSRLGGDKRVLVITDDTASARDDVALSSVPVDVVGVGKPADNVGIARFDVRRAVDPSTGRPRIEAFALLANFGASAVERFVVLRQRNTTAPIASRRLRIAPDERVPVVLSFEPALGDSGTGLVVELEPNDALSIDDRAYAIVPPDAALPVVVVPPDRSPWLERAFASDRDVTLYRATAVDLERGSVPDGALVVSVGTCPPRVPDGDVLVVDPPEGPCLGVNVGEVVEAPVLTSWAEVDPRFEFVDFEDVHLRRARQIRGLTGSEASLHAGDSTIAASLDIDGAHGTLLSFDPGESDWPLEASFVVFARNIAELARGARTNEGRAFFDAGAPLRFKVPRETERITLEDPKGEKQDLDAHDGVVIVPGASLAGFYFASWRLPRAGSTLMAAHFSAGNESDLRRGATSAKVPHKARAVASVARVADVSWLLAVVAIMLIVLDIWYVTRRPQTSMLKAAGRTSI